MDRDPEGQLRGYDMTNFQTVPCHIAGMVALSFQQSDTFAGHVGERLHLHSDGLYVTPEILYKLNKPYTKLRVALFFLA